MRQMDLRQLEYVVAVAEERNFTRAAARCHVVQSALSHRIARLEREQGVQLFDRNSRGVRLTPAGELLLPYARRALAEIDAATAELSALSGVISGTLRVGIIAVADAALSGLEATLAAYHREHPGVEVAISDSGSVQMAEQVRAGELDLAFVGLFADQVGAGLVHRTLTIEPLVAVVTSDHPLAARGQVGLAELAATGRSIELRPESGLRLQVDTAFARAGAARSIAFELGTLVDVIRFAGLGLGFAVVPLSSVAEAGPIAVLDLDDPLSAHPVSLIHRDPTPTAPSARAFLAALPDIED